MIDILIVEDNLDVRLSLINILKIDPEIRVIGEADSGFQAVEQAKILQPDLILMDIKLPGLDGLEAAKQIKELYAAKKRSIKILILSTFYDDDFVIKSQEYGIDGYLLKGLAFDKLAAAIKNICNGFVTLDRVIYERQNKLSAESTNNNSILSTLTENELRILKLIVKGKMNADIAAELYLTEGTVRNYISSMLSKLSCRNSREMVVLGIKLGL